MQKTMLGHTGLQVTPVGFGVLTVGPWQMNLPVREGAAVLRYALEAGINFLDTAQYYQTYPVIREALKGFSGADPVIASKSLDSSYRQMRDAIEESRRALNRDIIDIFMLHEVRGEEDFRERAGAWECLHDAKAKGLIRATGISTHHVDVAQAVANIPVTPNSGFAALPEAESGVCLSAALPEAESGVCPSAASCAAKPACPAPPSGEKTSAHSALSPMAEADILFPLINFQSLGIRHGQGGGRKEDMAAAIKAAAGAGKGVFAMKVFGGGNLTGSYREAVQYVRSLPGVQSLMMGFGYTHEIDRAIEIMEDRLPETYKPDISHKKIRIDQGDCMACLKCVKRCPNHAIHVSKEGTVSIDHKLCLTCGYCAPVCEYMAIIMY